MARQPYCVFWEDLNAQCWHDYDEGQDITHMPAHLRPTNTVFQNYAIFPHLNVEQNVAYGLRQQKLSREEQTEKVSAALAMVQLEGFDKRGADEMSGGQKQRVPWRGH
ncbi:MAG: hypothetical protein CM1200mP18_13870 [Gammaproteobacteria bacterium]|nr:MAG: hypothetical protein CM1200mP18_13870 [Gammaproteobacteria bacterium]